MRLAGGESTPIWNAANHEAEDLGANHDPAAVSTTSFITVFSSCRANTRRWRPPISSSPPVFRRGFIHAAHLDASCPLLHEIED